jgi:hypothetical protein
LLLFELPPRDFCPIPRESLKDYCSLKEFGFWPESVSMTPELLQFVLSARLDEPFFLLLLFLDPSFICFDPELYLD